MLLREKLVRAELAAARAGIREVGGNNHGPEVKRFLAEVGLPQGYAWCDAFQSYEMHAAAGRRLPIESAGVAQTWAYARQLGWDVKPFQSPARGDLVLYDFDNDHQTDDHIGIVTSVVALPGTWKLQTVEGNTSSGRAGSQDDGGGVYVRTRIVRRSTVAFVRIPGYVAEPPEPKKATPKSSASTPTLKKGARGPNVRTLQKLLAKHGARVVVDGEFGQRTTASVRAFQRRNGLKPDGQVGPKTWKKLRA